eukprot:5925552-Heterocapsa_arctica.AAC.1
MFDGPGTLLYHSDSAAWSPAGHHSATMRADVAKGLDYAGLRAKGLYPRISASRALHCDVVLRRPSHEALAPHALGQQGVRQLGLPDDPL